jgi:hypothetical protein
MRNDARPVGEQAGRRSPVPSHQPSREHQSPPPDGRDRVTHDRQSHIVNRRSEENVRRKDAEIDPTMPTGDSTLNTRI